MDTTVPRLSHILLGLALSGMLLLGEAIALFDPLRASLDRGTFPLHVTLLSSARKVRNIVTILPNIFSIGEQLRSAEVERALLEAEVIRLKEEVSEKERLLQQLRFHLPARYRQVPAYVLQGIDGVSVSVGSRDGVEGGMPVVVGDVLVGVIGRVLQTSSRVILTTDPRNEISVRIPEANTDGVLSGAFHTSMRLTQVLPDFPLEVGQRITTSGRDGRFPPGLSIGRIAAVDSSPASPVQSADVNPIFPIGSLRQVFILIES